MRSYDHREISRAMPEAGKQIVRDTGMNSMNVFGQTTGSLRFSMDASEVYVQTFSSIPSPEQVGAILKAAQGKTVLFDVTDATGRTLVSERIRKVNGEKLMDFISRTQRLFEGGEPAGKVSTLFQDIEPINRRMTNEEVSNYARALVREGKDALRSAVQNEPVRADRVAILDAAHQLDPKMAEAVAREASGMLFQEVYHGSPYKFDKFSLDHLGSGEGAQAYGWVS